ncbi:S9 family peptidase [Rhizomicrobium electricum]|uniref:S9 family peptidase n=1 Tax=Rhizomicrobium electricum TaxID=480070 RepID=A0ABP3PMV4_9PROT|nr:S9 family peptidase [Rhizomicrobium electricum]NIJ47050.1 dipeptidyl aminopeptidase/acylaminoacyl peptidase [Rhizomicrobium electricum]
MKSLLFAAIACAAAFTTAAGAVEVKAPLIERQKLFGNPTKAFGRLSPDGKWLAFIAPRDGVLNIFVAPINAPDAAKPLTTEKTRPIRSYFWAPDSKTILFVNDKGGDENFLLYGVDITTGAQKTLTPFEKTRVQVIGVSNQVKDHILIGLNNRDPKWHDVYALSLKDGALTKVLENNGYAGFLADDTLTLRGASRPNAAGGTDFFRIKDNKIDDKPFASTGLEDAFTTSPAGFTTDGKTLYWIDSRGRDKAALMAQDVATGAMSVVAASDKADIGSALANPKTGKVEAYSVDYLKNEWTAIDPAVKGDLEFLQKNLKGDVQVSSRTYDDDLWTVGVDPVSAPPAVYLYDRKAKTLKKLWVSRPELEGLPLSAMHPVEIKTRDGLTEVSYLTLPAGSDTKTAGVPDKPLPMVLVVHGGPWSRDGYGFNSYHQWLANRGYAVLSVNYRGSTGFGKKYIEAANLQWGLKMHDDLIDAVDWAIKNGITTKDKVAIMGGSYGGYATLAGLTFTPDTFACGVDIVGPSNLNTLLKTIPAYWEPIKLQFYKRMGDPTTPEGQKILNAASPLFKADAIKKPLLIGQGANDPRVNQAESDQIVKAMADKKIPVTYVLFPDEGHGFARPANNIAFNAVAEQFLAKNLGGRAEPIGDAVKQSTAKVPHGAEFVPGVPEALK